MKNQPVLMRFHAILSARRVYARLHFTRLAPSWGSRDEQAGSVRAFTY
jgi:hypothetical protein